MSDEVSDEANDTGIADRHYWAITHIAELRHARADASHTVQTFHDGSCLDCWVQACGEYISERMEIAQPAPIYSTVVDGPSL